MAASHAEAMAVLAEAHLVAGRRSEARPLVEEAHAFWTTFAPEHAEAARLARLLQAVDSAAGELAP